VAVTAPVTVVMADDPGLPNDVAAVSRARNPGPGTAVV